MNMNGEFHLGAREDRDWLEGESGDFDEAASARVEDGREHGESAKANASFRQPLEQEIEISATLHDEVEEPNMLHEPLEPDAPRGLPSAMKNKRFFLERGKK
jgi:hypothetical protein